MLLVDEADSLAIAALGIDIVGAVPIDLSQLEQQDALLHSITCAQLGALLILCDGIHRIALYQVNVAHGIVHLIQVVLVVGVLGHALERLHHLGSRAAAHRLGLLYAGIEFQFVRRV